MEKKTVYKLVAVVFLLILLASLIAAIVFFLRSGNEPTDDEENMPHDYTYGTTIASNGMVLHYLRTRPANIKLETVRNNVTLTPYYGINGGFFYQDALLSIAIANDVPVHPAVGQYGTGGANAKYARGTLVWDEDLDQLSVQVVKQAAELVVTDRSRYWAQGGISMSLDRDDLWLEQIDAEAAPLPNDYCLRSAAVYDSYGDLYLVVSTTRGSLAVFREAIVEKIGEGKLVNGVFLDGDGSSQLRSREAKLKGDGRPVVQMLSLIK